MTKEENWIKNERAESVWHIREYKNDGLYRQEYDDELRANLLEYNLQVGYSDFFKISMFIFLFLGSAIFLRNIISG